MKAISEIKKQNDLDKVIVASKKVVEEEEEDDLSSMPPLLMLTIGIVSFGIVVYIYKGFP